MTGQRPLAFYVPSLTVGGAERVTVTIANGLAEQEYNVDLLVSFCEGEFKKEVRSDVRLIDLETPSIPGIGIGAAVPALRRYLRTESPSMIFSQMTYANDVCLFAHGLVGSDAVAVPTVHNTLGVQESPKEKFVEWLAGRLSDRADQFVAVSDGAAESIVEHVGVSPEDVTVLHNPIPVEEVRMRSREPVDHEWVGVPEYEVVLGVGRLEPQKNFGSFLKAFKRVHEARPQTRAIIVGRGSERGELRQLVRDLGISDRVSFPGYVDNPYGYMAGASVLAMSSVHEGLPTVIIEALACGCPVVSTDCPSGPYEILEGGEVGPLVPVGDESALADEIHTTLADPPQKERLIERARDFAPEAVLRDYEAFIQAHLPTAAPAHRTA